MMFEQKKNETNQNKNALIFFFELFNKDGKVGFSRGDFFFWKGKYFNQIEINQTQCKQAMVFLSLKRSNVSQTITNNSKNVFKHNILSFKFDNRALYNELKTLSKDEMIDDYGNSDDINLKPEIIKDISNVLFLEFAEIIQSEVFKKNLKIKSIFIHIYIEPEMSKFILYDLRFDLKKMFNPTFWNSLLMSYAITLPLRDSQKHQFILYTPIKKLNRFPYF